MSSGRASFAKWFEETFGEQLPLALPLEVTQTDETTHWSSAPSHALSASALMLPTFPDIPGDYLVAGHWGYGIANHAFYWVERTGDHRCFFRLPFGGAYGSNDEGSEIVRFMRRYATWRACRPATILESELVWSMGTALATFHLERAGREVMLQDDGRDVPLAENGAQLPASTWWDHIERVLSA